MRISVDFKGVEEANQLFSGATVRKAAKYALNDTGRQARTAASREIRRKWNLTATTINERVKIETFANEAGLEVTISAGNKGRKYGIDLTLFGARWVHGNRVLSRKGAKLLKRPAKKEGEGVFVTIYHGKNTFLEKTFIARMKSGHMGVFRRKSTKRLPLIRKGAISIGSMFNQEEVQKVIRDLVDAKFPERFRYHLDRISAD